IGDVVGALMRHPIAEEISAALRNDGEPTSRVVFEGVALKRVELIADEDRDGHDSLRGIASHILPRSVESMLLISPNYAGRASAPRPAGCGSGGTARRRLGRRSRRGDAEMIAGRVERAQAVAVGRIA